MHIAFGVAYVSSVSSLAQQCWFTVLGVGVGAGASGAKHNTQLHAPLTYHLRNVKEHRSFQFAFLKKPNRTPRVWLLIKWNERLFQNRIHRGERERETWGINAHSYVHTYVRPNTQKLFCQRRKQRNSYMHTVCGQRILTLTHALSDVWQEWFTKVKNESRIRWWIIRSVVEEETKWR